MGSRGQKVEKALPGGGGDGDLGGGWSNGLGFKNYDTLKDAIGKKGRPMGMANAVLNANPHWDPNYTYKEFTENCQRCVVAYELRRRGYDVTAQPTYQGDLLPTGVVRRDGLRNGRWRTTISRASRSSFMSRQASREGGSDGKQGTEL